MEEMKREAEALKRKKEESERKLNEAKAKLVNAEKAGDSNLQTIKDSVSTLEKEMTDLNMKQDEHEKKEKVVFI